MALKRLVKEEKGSQLVEFILVFPFIWILLMFCMDQFTMMYNKQKALAAAYEAGRIAAVQPNYGLAKYHAKQRGGKELEQAMGVTESDVLIRLEKRWGKGEHLEAIATLSFTLPATGEQMTLKESYFMMIENSEQ